MARIPNDSRAICYAVQFPNRAVKSVDPFGKKENNIYLCDQNFEMKRENGIDNTRTLWWASKYHQTLFESLDS